MSIVSLSGGFGAGDYSAITREMELGQRSSLVSRCLGLLGLAILLAFAARADVPATDKPPATPREFRGVWVASVNNIDWPSKKGLSTAEQEAGLRAIFDKAAELNLNAVIFQIRPMADALYRSELEPWSEYLSGALGKPPSPLYDPLELAVQEAHKRGLELHAWFNPFRARHPSSTSPVPDNHLIKRRPDLAKRYGAHYWLNPTSKEVQEHSLRVILDVVRRYDVDGIHIDDYFYPYKEKDPNGKALNFPDENTWVEYQLASGTLRRADWRRVAINHFIERMYHEVKKAKPWVQVGISPFGIWKPDNPPGITGFNAFAEIYADSRLWFKEGWCDYLAPQLYWPIHQQSQSFPRLLAWWNEQNDHHRHLWPGLYTSRVTGAAKGWPANEIADQIMLTRKQPGATGDIHFSMKALVHNAGGVADALKEVYAKAALVPATTWAKVETPVKPTVRWQKDELTLRIRSPQNGVRRYVVWVRHSGYWRMRVHPAVDREETVVHLESRPERVFVSAISRVGVESDRVKVTANE
jgi:uncharacterized lipoprotein YddW (UPF0748 family)